MASILESEIRQSFNHFKVWWEKFHSDSRHIQKRPFDFIAARYESGKMRAIECKMIRIPSFKFSVLPPHQEKGLYKFSSMKGAWAYVLVNFRRDPPGVCFAVDIHKYISLKKILKGKRSSIPIDLFYSHAIQLERINISGPPRYLKGWNLEAIL